MFESFTHRNGRTGIRNKVAWRGERHEYATFNAYLVQTTIEFYFLIQYCFKLLHVSESVINRVVFECFLHINRDLKKGSTQMNIATLFRLEKPIIFHFDICCFLRIKLVSSLCRKGMINEEKYDFINTDIICTI